jgi:hypothetical protein
MSYSTAQQRSEYLMKVDRMNRLSGNNNTSFDESCTDTSNSSDEDYFDSSPIANTPQTTIPNAFTSTSNLPQCISVHHKTTTSSNNKVAVIDDNSLMMSLEMVKMLRKSTSEGNLHILSPRSLGKMATKPVVSQHQLSVPCKVLPARSKCVVAKYSSIANAIQEKKRMLQAPTNHNALVHYQSPKETIKQILRNQHELELNHCRYNDIVLDNYFVKGVTNCRTADATQLLMRAIRDDDLKTIQELHQVMDCNLQCCNKFQESIVHTVARRGYVDILQYLHNVAGVSLRVCCDMGRNALHDACWTSTPNFHSIQMFVQDSPDLLYIADKRNNTPLDYIPKEAYPAWNKWLQINAHLLKPTVLPSK